MVTLFMLCNKLILSNCILTLIPAPSPYPSPIFSQTFIQVNNYQEQQTIYDVIGTIYGQVEPDQMVILGNHRDAWVFGAVDPNSGTAVLEEIARAFGTLRTKGWRPGRTIVLCSWDAEEPGLIGSTEWVEVGGREACLCMYKSHDCLHAHTQERQKVLGPNTVAYLNVDTAVAGTTCPCYGMCCSCMSTSHLQVQHFYLLVQILCCSKCYTQLQSWYVVICGLYCVRAHLNAGEVSKPNV